jgi:small-conductance mechanosensitive channel
MNQTAYLVAVQAQETGEVVAESDVPCEKQGPLCDALLEWTDNEAFAEITSWILGTPIKIMIIVATALILNRIVRRLINAGMERLGNATAEHGESVVSERSVRRAQERATTIGSLLRSLSTAVILGLAFIMILEVLGISVVAAVLSAGVLSLAIGFGAQSIVEDLLRGLFMLGEDQFGVGDRIDVGLVNGTVERVTLRTTVIRDAQGTLWHVPNSQIDSVANENQQSSRATIEIGVSYTTDLEAAIEVLAQAAQNAADDPNWQRHVKRPPEVQGVETLGDDAVIIRVIVWVDAGERRRFERHLRLRLKEGLDAAEIEMPNRQFDVWLRGQPQAV